MIQILFRAKDLNCSKIERFLKMGSLIIYPTDTVYGLGGIIDSKEVLEKIYAVKEREMNYPLVALISQKEKVYEVANVSVTKKKVVNKLIEAFWPGALTIILKKKDIILKDMVSNGETIGVRMPNHEVALKIIESVGGILATTSANISGEPSPIKFSEVSKKIKSRVDLIVEDNSPLVGIESTIIDLSGRKIKILRNGAITSDEIEAIIGEVE